MSESYKKLGIGLSLFMGVMGIEVLQTPAHAATLKQNIFLAGEIIENSIIFNQDIFNFNQVVAEAFIPIISETLQFSLSSPENPTVPKSSLSFDSVVNSISQLRFDAPNSNDIAVIEVLPPTSPEQIMRGVYEFELPAIVSQSTDVYVFEDPQASVSGLNYNRSPVGLPTVSPLNAPSSGLDAPFYGAMRGGGLNVPVYGGVRLISAENVSGLFPSVSGVRTPVQNDSGSIRAQFAKIWQDNVDARLDMYPDEIPTEMPNEIQGGLLSNVNDIDQIFDLKVDVAFRTMPQDVFPTPLDLQADYVKNSPMLNQNYANARLKVTEDFRNYLQENAQEQQEKITTYQRDLNQRLYERNRSLRERQQQFRP